MNNNVFLYSLYNIVFKERFYDMRRNKVIVSILSLAIVSSTIVCTTPESSAQTFNQYQNNSNAPADDSNFTTIFAFPYKTVAKNEEMIRKMNSDMITFGPRIYPPNAWEDKGKPDYPQELIDTLGTDQLYYFAGDVEWENNPNGRLIKTSQGDWYAIKSAGKWVVNKKGSNKYMNATQAANNVGADFYLGMPIPQRWEKQPWLIDESYRDVMRSFNEEYVKNYRSVVDGYYQMGEITLNATSSWQPFFDNFEDQFEAIKKNDPDAIVINSPYIRSAKTNDKNKVINDSVEGYKKLLNMSKGLNFVLAPQDGLGTDTTALKKDNSTRHSVTTEEVFEALSKVNKDRLFSNTENMRVDFTDGKRDPNTGELLNGQSKITTVDRVKDQVAAVKNDVSGFIAFMWNHLNTPMTKVDGIEELLDGGFGGLKEISYKADDRFTVSDAYNISYDKSSVKQSESKKLSPVMKEGNDKSNKSSRYLYSGGKWEVENGYPWITVNQLGDITIKPTDKVKPGQYDPKVTVTFNDNSKQVVPLSINVSGTTPKPTSDKPTTPKPTSDKPTSDKPTTSKPTSNKPTSDKPTTNKPTSDKPTTSKPTTNKPTSDKPTTPKPTSDKPTTPKPTSDKPITSSPTADKPVDNPTTDKPTTSSSATDKPSVESSTSDDVSSTINNDNKNDDTSSLTTTTTSSDTTPTTKDTPTTIKEDVDSTSTASSSTQEDTDNTDNTDNKNDDNLNKFSPIKNKKNETVNKKGSQSAPLNNNSQQVRDNQKVVNDEELDSPQDTLKVDTGGSITKNIAVMIKQIFN